jgi:hypothetical protein
MYALIQRMHFPHLSILVPSILASLALTFAARPGGKGTPPFLEALLHFLLFNGTSHEIDILWISVFAAIFTKNAFFLGKSLVFCKGLGKISIKVREKVFCF